MAPLSVVSTRPARRSQRPRWTSSPHPPQPRLRAPV